MREFLLSQGVSQDLIDAILCFKEKYNLSDNLKYRIPRVKYKYYAKILGRRQLLPYFREIIYFYQVQKQLVKMYLLKISHIFLVDHFGQFH